MSHDYESSAINHYHISSVQWKHYLIVSFLWFCFQIMLDLILSTKQSFAFKISALIYWNAHRTVAPSEFPSFLVHWKKNYEGIIFVLMNRSWKGCKICYTPDQKASSRKELSSNRKRDLKKFPLLFYFSVILRYNELAKRFSDWEDIRSAGREMLTIIMIHIYTRILQEYFIAVSCWLRCLSPFAFQKLP